MNPPLIDAHERERCEQHLRALVDGSARLHGATLSSIDGFELGSAARGAGQVAHGGRLAAVTSSLQALAAAAVKELGLGRVESVTIEGDGGRMLTIGLQAGARALVLSAVAGKSSVLAMNLVATRECAAAIAASLGGAPLARIEAPRSFLPSTH